jgi:hypothetical protein
MAPNNGRFSQTGRFSLISNRLNFADHPMSAELIDKDHTNVRDLQHAAEDPMGDIPAGM